MRIIIFLLVVSFSIQASFAQSTESPSISKQTMAVTNFMQLYSSLGLINCNTNSDHGLAFAEGTSQVNIDTVTAAATTFDWTGATLIPLNPLGFQLKVAQDKAIPAASLLEFCKYAGVISQTTQATIPVLQGLWAAACASDSAFSGNCVDDPTTLNIDESTITIQARIQADAAANGITLPTAQ